MQKTLIITLFLIFNACSSAKQTVLKDDGKIEVKFLQINDVYEIQPLENGKVGGLARLATLKRELLAQNPNTFFTLSGDFFSPSFYGTLKVNGETLRGKQMVDVLNVAGLDMATFGNHEFDIPLADVQKRLNESQFDWVSANVNYTRADSTTAFFKVTNGRRQYIPKFIRKTVKDADGTSAQICFSGVTLPSNQRDYTQYDDIFASVDAVVRDILPACNAIVLLTHLSMEDDIKLAEKLAPYGKVMLLMGGHEHERNFKAVSSVLIAKADANAKSAYIHTLSIDFKNRKTALTSQIKEIDSSIASDELTQLEVEKWEEIARETMKNSGNTLSLSTPVANLITPLEGREREMRTSQTNLGAAVTQAMLLAAKNNPDAAIFNSGSIRLDDQLNGEITILDILRTLPFGGGLVEFEIEGAELRKTLTVGNQNAGSGGYLQWANIRQQEEKWYIGSEELNDTKIYRIITTDYLFAGLERNLGFLKEGNPAIKSIWKPNPQDTTDLRNSIQQALIFALSNKR